MENVHAWRGYTIEERREYGVSKGNPGDKKNKESTTSPRREVGWRIGAPRGGQHEEGTENRETGAFAEGFPTRPQNEGRREGKSSSRIFTWGSPGRTKRVTNLEKEPKKKKIGVHVRKRKASKGGGQGQLEREDGGGQGVCKAKMGDKISPGGAIRGLTG